MTDHEELVACLTDRDAKAACAYTDFIVAQSLKSNTYYKYLEDYAALLHHKNSLVRNRAISILAANARWDTENLYESLINELLAHVTDEKPITARECVKALALIGAAKQNLIPGIQAALENADLSGYPDSMQPLILKDIICTMQQLSAL